MYLWREVYIIEETRFDWRNKECSNHTIMGMPKFKSTVIIKM